MGDLMLSPGWGGGGNVLVAQLLVVGSLQLCSPPGSSVHEILQARILEWVAGYSLLQGIFMTQDQIQVSRIAGEFFTF